jgi:CheY-like chemotaxis protein
VAVQPRPKRRFVPESVSVLLVDDQPFFRVLLTEVLRAMGVREITTAVDGNDAMEAYDMLRPDIILTDWVMPDCDGLELTRNVRNLSDEVARAVPIILITANNQKTQIDAARNCGVDNFILKPVSVKSVAERLREVIERPRPFVVTNSYRGPCRRRRSPENFAGPFRRFDDPIELDTPSTQKEVLRSMMEMAAQRIAALVRELRGGKLSSLAPIRLASEEVRSLASDLGDLHLARICKGLCHYLDRLPSPNAVRIDVLQTHLDAMEVILKTPLEHTAIRDQVVMGLEKVVSKTLKAA